MALIKLYKPILVSAQAVCFALDTVANLVKVILLLHKALMALFLSHHVCNFDHFLPFLLNPGCQLIPSVSLGSQRLLCQKQSFPLFSDLLLSGQLLLKLSRSNLLFV